MAATGAPSMETLWSAFVAVADRQPDAPALIFGPQRTSFHELKMLAQRAQALLLRHDAGLGKVVALQLPKRVETYALLLACLRLGAPYVFIDPKNPPARTGAILDRVKPVLLFSAVTLENPHGAVLPPPDAGALAVEEAAGPPASVPGPDDAAYIMFTSGSTGEPKGAIIPHRGIAHLMAWSRRDITHWATRCFSAINPLHFDNSVFDIYCGLVSGNTLAPIETGEQANPAAWARLLREAQVDVMFAVPTLFMMLDEMGLLTTAVLPGLRTFIFGGEGYPVARLRDFHGRFTGQAELVNVYGPTETSCICSSITVTPALMDAANGKFVSLGRMHDPFIHSIGDPRAPAALGEPGELWIGGPCVGLGYYRNADETARRFLCIGGTNYYRSGDVVREEQDGLLYFQGRADNQVKIRGHRVELEEIDAAVESTPGVHRAVTVALAVDEEIELQVAYAGTASREAIVVRCRERLPAYMHPCVIVALEALPLNANGKVDRLAAKKLLNQRQKR